GFERYYDQTKEQRAASLSEMVKNANSAPTAEKEFARGWLNAQRAAIEAANTPAPTPDPNAILANKAEASAGVGGKVGATKAETPAPAKPKPAPKPRTRKKVIEDSNLALIDFRERVRKTGIKPPTDLGLEDFGVTLPPGTWRKSSKR